MKKIILVSAGCTSLSIGVIGIFVPLLPTTPFLLLASACFIRSSDRLYQWLIHHKLFGNYIRCYIQFRAVSKRAKVVSVSLLWTFIGYSAVFIVNTAWLRILLALIATGVTVHILRLRTLTKEMKEIENPPPNKKKNGPGLHPPTAA